MAAKRATNERAQSDLARYKPLVATDDVSKFQFDSVDAAARVAKSELDAAEQQRAAAQQAVLIARANARSAQARVVRSQSQFLETKAREQQVPITEATYKSSLAAVERAKAVLQQAELNLAYTQITAPITGQVTQKSVDLGQYVSPGQLLFTIVPLNQVYVTANFKETQLANVAPGQKVRFHVDTYRQEFEGVGRFHRGSDRLPAGLAPAAKRNGKFHQSGAAHPGEDSGQTLKQSESGVAPRHERRSHDLYPLIFGWNRMSFLGGNSPGNSRGVGEGGRTLHQRVAGRPDPAP